jgi:hypothetical protein
VSDPLTDLFSAEIIAEMRASLIESTGEAPPVEPRQLLVAFIRNNLQVLAEKLENLEGLTTRLAKHTEEVQGPGHAIFTYGRASEAISSARRLLLFSALKSIEHALVCNHQEQEEQPCSTPTN